MFPIKFLKLGTLKINFNFRMVLVLNGVLQEEVPLDSRTLYAAHPIYRDTAAQLQMLPAKLVGPAGLLYVQQREMAATLPHDSKITNIFYVYNFNSIYLLNERRYRLNVKVFKMFFKKRFR